MLGWVRLSGQEAQMGIGKDKMRVRLVTNNEIQLISTLTFI